METSPPAHPKTHPLILVAAASVTVASLAGLASLFGWLPDTRGPAPQAPAATLSQAAAVGAPPQPAPPAASETAPEKPATPPAGGRAAAHPANERPARRTAAHPAPAPAAALPPPPPPAQSAQPPQRLAANPPEPPPPPPNAAPEICRDCGTVESVRLIEQQGSGTGLGVVAGGILGGVLGHQVGKGHGRDAATVAGALGGAWAGNQVERNARASERYRTTVRMDDGTTRSVVDARPPLWHNGDRVRVVDGRILGL